MTEEERRKKLEELDSTPVKRNPRMTVGEAIGILLLGQSAVPVKEDPQD